MNNSDITICMALHNKNECLENTLFSIKNQKTSYSYNMCFFDDASKTDPLPIIKKYFTNTEFLIKRSKSPVGFELLYGQYLNFLPKETKLLILQSCDVIWGDENLLDRLVQAMTCKDKPGSYKKAVCVPKKIDNYQVPVDFYKNGDVFYKSLGGPSDKSLWGHSQRTSYLFLGAMRRVDFEKTLSEKMYHSNGVCDLVVKDTLFGKFKVPLITTNGTVIHQRHPGYVYECASINQCTHPCKTRRSMISNGIRFPFYKGIYNRKLKKWENFPTNKKGSKK